MKTNQKSDNHSGDVSRSATELRSSWVTALAPLVGNDWPKRKRILTAVLLSLAASVCAQTSELLVIAHRGASGYLPEHTLEAKVLAYEMGADYLEQDLVLTKDDVPIVMHDIHLETISDVALRFPDRKRSDGQFYALDFTLAEIKQLRVNERINPKP